VKQRRTQAPPRQAPTAAGDPFFDVVEWGLDLIMVTGFTPGGAPFGPRVAIVDGEITFIDEPPAGARDDGGAR
jgi:hypothetical protein